MIILGVTHPISWSSGACILVDGRLIAMGEEERFTRFKYAKGGIASESIDSGRAKETLEKLVKITQS